MDPQRFTEVMAERLRLRAALWKRDAESTTNRELKRLMLRTANDLEAEAAGLKDRT